MMLIALGALSCGVVSTQGTRGTEGGLITHCEPGSAEVWVDGQMAGRCNDFDGEDQILELSSGTHRVEIKKEGYRTYRKDIYISHATDEIRVRLAEQ